jgi:carbonic anhydrase
MARFMAAASRLLVVLGLLALVMAATGSTRAQGPVHWSYDGEAGPEHWGELSPDYALCSTGQEQSPINIPAAAPLNPANLTYSYLPSSLTILNNGHTVQVNYDAGSELVIKGERYQLVQFHFHAHSEHTLDGHAAPLELHLVHSNAQGALAVVGVWIESGGENAAFAPIMSHLPASESPAQTVPGEQVDAQRLLPTERTYYRYNGSLTTPPCAEHVTWLMLKTPVEISAAQIGAYTALFDHTYRPTQPLNGRSFLLTEPGMPLPDTGVADEQPVAAPRALPSTGSGQGQPAGILVLLGGLSTAGGLWLRRGARREARGARS